MHLKGVNFMACKLYCIDCQKKKGGVAGGEEEDSESSQFICRIWDSAFQNCVLLPKSNLPAIPTPCFLKDY